MDPNLPALLARQHGNLTRQQLLALGLGTGAVKHRVRVGRLHRVHRGVYAVGRPPTKPIERAAAAVLACGASAVLSHESGLALWGLAKLWPTPAEVTVTTDRRPAGITVHRSATLTRKDITRHHGIRVTTPARTLRDCAPRLTDKRLARAVNDALLSNHLTPSQLAEVLQRTPCPRLVAFIATADGPTRSEFEDAFLEFCEEHGLPRPQTNVTIAGHEVDAFFAEQNLIVELDGYRFHSSRQSFEHDRDKAADTLAAGLPTVHVTWERMAGSAVREAARLKRILSRASRQARH